MDVQLRGIPPHSYGVGNTPVPPDMNMQQLEQECLQFFESTIDSLDESLEAGEEQGQWAPRAAGRNGVDGTAPAVAPVMSSSPAPPWPLLSRTLSQRDDIIDLVPSREAFFNPAMPDFQSLASVPSSHQETRPRQDPGESQRPPEGRPAYCPPGCVPTPVLIAQKLAENQGGPPPHTGPSAPPHRRSLEPERAAGPPEHGARPGPPTAHRPTRFPANISVGRANREPAPALASVNIHERQALMLANLPGGEALAGQEEEAAAAATAAQRERVAPARSISFRDPTPGRSRMEALSKLGLRSRAASGGETFLVTPQARPGAEPSAPEGSAPPAAAAAAAAAAGPPGPPGGRPEVRRDGRPDPAPVGPGQSGRERPVHGRPQPPAAPAAAEVPASSYPPPPPPPPADGWPPPAPRAAAPASPDFNSYGGRTVVIVPAAPAHPRAPPPRAAGHAHGGKSRVMAARSELPDILSAHVEPPPASGALRGGGGAGALPPAAAAPRGARAPAPSTAPKPVRHLPPSPSSSSLQRARPASPESRRRSMASKPPAPAFRAHGVTVQFSGKGAMDDSRRAALRKLGLMKDTG